MVTFSIIVPSFNQEKYIEATLLNLKELKIAASKQDINIQVIVVDNCSSEPTASIIQKFKSYIDNLVIEPDKGQYDAINKGLSLVKGRYWTWLNTDDLIDIEGFFNMAEYLNQNPGVDYIYGAITYIDEQSQHIKLASSKDLSLNQLIYKDASISQPGSFFRTAFTKELGQLSSFQFAFDYEYILRCLKNRAVVKRLAYNLAYFRYYSGSKSGSQDYRFLKEQLKINKLYGGKLYHRLGFTLFLRIIKRRLFN